MINAGAGVIDYDYRGEVTAVLFNHSNTDLHIERGMRVAQLILERVSMAQVREVAKLQDTSRGANGFGSAGVASPAQEVLKFNVDVKSLPIRANHEESVNSEGGSDLSDATLDYCPFEVVTENEDEFAVQVFAAAATPVAESVLEIFQILKRWIADTGCGKDTISMKTAKQWQQQWVENTPITFWTANGPASATTGMPMRIQAFNNQYATPYVMASAPAFISLGMGLFHYKFSFTWLPGKLPCFITRWPQLRVIVLMVHGDIPYLDGATFKRYWHATDEEIFEAIGVYTRPQGVDGQVEIVHPYPDFPGGYANKPKARIKAAPGE